MPLLTFLITYLLTYRQLPFLNYLVNENVSLNPSNLTSIKEKCVRVYRSFLSGQPFWLQRIRI